MKLEDLLHKFNPWQGLDCNRELCLLCKTKETTGKNKGQECTKCGVWTVRERRKKE